MTGAVGEEAPQGLDDVPGSFFRQDQALLHWLLDWQDRTVDPGDLLEIGTYLGKSAILIGTHVRPEERFTVCDPFGGPVADPDEDPVVADARSTHQRERFEQNYLAFHAELPVVVSGPPAAVGRQLGPGSCRFVHLDGVRPDEPGRPYDQARRDLDLCRRLLRPDGFIACDDYRAAEAPGVAASIWGAVLTGGLRPICLSGNKFYGTWGDPAPAREALAEWLNTQGPDTFTYEKIDSHRLMRIHVWASPPRVAIKPRLVKGRAPTFVVPEVRRSDARPAAEQPEPGSDRKAANAVTSWSRTQGRYQGSAPVHRPAPPPEPEPKSWVRSMARALRRGQ